MSDPVVLKRNEVAFEPASKADPHGRVFRHGGRLYRAINPAIARTYRDLLNDPRCTRLFDLGLIDTEIADLDLEGAGLVLRHRELPHVTYGLEWCAPMFLDAARLTIDLAIELDTMGFELLDAHPWNVLFEGPTPRFIDFGSIVPAKPGTPWRSQDQFFTAFVNPLRLLINGQGDTARQMMTRPRIWGVTDREAASLSGTLDRLAHAWQKLTALPGPNEPRTSALPKLRAYLDRVEIAEPTTEWSDYYNDYADLDDPTTWTAKQRVADDVLRRVKPKTVLDLAANAGWFSRLAERHGCTVVATDNDETCLANLYQQAKAQGLNINTVVQDFSKPTEAHGESSQFPDAYTRLRADLVFALAITHHLVFKAGMGFDQIAQTLAGFTDGELLVEFVPREDRHVAQWYTEEYAWYTLKNFTAALARHFDGITETPSNVQPRVLITCKKKQAAVLTRAA
jgi:SAM-dependent methyltransferase